jgi:hypothetical protein
MPLSSQSIRKGVIISKNNIPTDKQEIIELSKSWSESQVLFFKKMIKQGGTFKINEDSFKIIAQEPLLTSRGEKDGGIIVYPE